MEFVIENHSRLAPYLQIQEQIKLALLLGRLRPGDTLPSIRDVQQQAMISPNIVRKAYQALERSGIVNRRHGKGVLVAKRLDYKHDSKLLESCEELARKTISEIRRRGISPAAFARYLYQKGSESERSVPTAVYVDATKTLAVERAAQISSVWQTHVPGFALEELTELKKNRTSFPSSALTNYYRLDRVQKLLGKSNIQVIPLGLRFTPKMLAEFARLPEKAMVVLVLDDDDYPSLSLILASYREVLVDDTVKLSSVPFGQIGDLRKFLAKSKFDKIIMSNRIWEQVPHELKKDNRLRRPLMDVDLVSLEGARIKAGIIV
jgi:GntR family transcriptional regulator